jgi:hypothetical protein
MDHAAQAGICVASAIGNVADRSIKELSHSADQAIAKAGSCVSAIGSRLGTQADSNSIIGTTAHAIGESIEAGGEYVNRAKLTGIVKDAGRAIRRNPALAIGFAFGFGWLWGHRMRK